MLPRILVMLYLFVGGLAFWLAVHAEATSATPDPQKPYIVGIFWPVISVLLFGYGICVGIDWLAKQPTRFTTHWIDWTQKTDGIPANERHTTPEGREVPSIDEWAQQYAESHHRPSSPLRKKSTTPSK